MLGKLLPPLVMHRHRNFANFRKFNRIKILFIGDLLPSQHGEHIRVPDSNIVDILSPISSVKIICAFSTDIEFSGFSRVLPSSPLVRESLVSALCLCDLIIRFDLICDVLLDICVC